MASPRVTSRWMGRPETATNPVTEIRPAGPAAEGTRPVAPA
jgi:hypothetical protein